MSDEKTVHNTVGTDAAATDHAEFLKHFNTQSEDYRRGFVDGQKSQEPLVNYYLNWATTREKATFEAHGIISKMVEARARWLTLGGALLVVNVIQLIFTAPLIIRFLGY